MKKGKIAYWMGRGFTLVELMVVVIIVGVLAAIIIPTASRAMRARRGSGAASHIALAYRMAKMRAMGRGNAVLVRYSAGQVQTFEAATLDNSLAKASSSAQLLASCISDRWNNCTSVSTTCIPIDLYKDPGESLSYKLLDAGNVEISDPFDVCFTPSGNSYYRKGTTSFAAMTNWVPQIQVWLGVASESIVHTVYVLPNGAARVVSRQGT